MDGQGLINLALKDLGEIAEDETPTSGESSDGLATLNHIIASWSNEGLVIAGLTHTTFSLAADTAAYTMGVGATWVTTARPMKIVGAEAYSGKFKNGIECVSYAEYRRRTKNATGLTATLPELLGFDNAAATVAVRLHPTPNATASIEIDYWMPLTQVATLATALAFPEGFEWALRTALVIALAPMYGRTATQEHAANAQTAKNAIIAINQSLLPAPPQAA
jgi:hypothetical protein